MTIRRTSYLPISLLFTGSILLFCWGLRTQEIVGFESRFYLFALEMYKYGLSWFPTTYHKPYPDYPVSSTLLIFLTAKLYGGLNKLVAVFPSACMAAISIVMTYLIGATQSKRWGLGGVLFLILTFSFFQNARTLSIDMYSVAITTTCFYVAYTMQGTAKKFIVLLLLLSLGFCIRGPIGLIIPTGVLTVFFALDGEYKTLLIFGFTAVLLLLLCTALLLGLAHAVGNASFMQAVLRMQIFGRMEANSLSHFYYLTTGFGNYALSFPFAMLVSLAVVYESLTTKKLTPELNFLLKLIAWILIIILGMSIPGDKKARYILAISPAIALLAAYPFVTNPTQTFIKYIASLENIILKLLPTLLICLVASGYVYAKQHGDVLPFNPIFITSALVILQIASLFLSKKNNFYVLLFATISFVCVYVAVIEKVLIEHDKTKNFVLNIEAQRLLAHAKLAFYHEGTDGLPIKYLINMPKEELPLFLHDENELTNIHRPTFFISSETSFRHISVPIAKQLHMIRQAKFGHEKVVVFIKGVT